MAEVTKLVVSLGGVIHETGGPQQALTAIGRTCAARGGYVKLAIPALGYAV